MKKTIYTKFDKNAISNLPQASFAGRIIVVLTESEAEKAVDYLLTADILGMDTETKPSFHRGESNKVALLQVSTRDTCFLFRLNLIGLCPAVIRLLENTAVPMIGLSWHDDLRVLHRRGNFTPGRFIELQELVGTIGIKDLSLQKLYANLFAQKISKRQRLTNWEAQILNDQQKQYAALDAWACIQLYEEIVRLKATADYDLVVVPEPEQPQPKTKTDEAAADDKQPKPKRRRKKTATTDTEKIKRNGPSPRRIAQRKRAKLKALAARQAAANNITTETKQ